MTSLTLMPAGDKIEHMKVNGGTFQFAQHNIPFPISAWENLPPYM